MTDSARQKAFEEACVERSLARTRALVASIEDAPPSAMPPTKSRALRLAVLTTISVTIILGIYVLLR